MPMNRKQVVLLCGVLTLVPGWCDARGAVFPISAPHPEYPKVRQIRFGFILQNETNRLVEKAEFWAYAPVSRTATQKCLRIETSQPCELISDEFGNQILHFSFQELPPHGKKVIAVKAELAVSELPQPVAEQQTDRWLQPEKYIESDHPRIVRLARELVRETPAGTVRAIFRWVADNIVYGGYRKEDRGALRAVETQSGDCTEHAALFVALARASGIPARRVAGYVCGENQVLRPGGFHDWAEVYRAGAWMVADPQNHILAANQSQYIAFRVVGGPGASSMGDAPRFRSDPQGLKVQFTRLVYEDRYSM